MLTPSSTAAVPHAEHGNPAIAAASLWKTFRVPHERYSSVRDRMFHPFTNHEDELLHALRDVSFEVERGAFFGIVGKNGSGKSTLLRSLAGIYPVDSGSIAVEGRLAPFIELGVGFSPELAARDNAITNAVMFGLDRREAAARFHEMLAFAELERFVDQKLKNYSTGMQMRLAFAVTVHVDADVLLFDEVLAVGDAAFREKCLGRFEQLRAEGKTIILVTHAMDLVRSFCDRALLLHLGEVVALGDAATVADAYEELNEGRVPPRPAAGALAEPPVARAKLPLLGAQPRRFLPLVRTLAGTDFQLKYEGTALNWLWAIARPLALFGALLLIFTALGRFTHSIAHYPAILLLGIVFWTFFSQATAGSVQSLARRATILRKLPFPHLAVPISVVLTSLYDLAVNLVVAFAFVLASGIAPRASWLELPVLVFLLGALATGLSLLLSALFVRFRDIDQIWQVASQTIFWLTPVFYVITSLPQTYERALLLANPIADILTQARHAIVDPSAPSAAAAIGGWVFLLVPLATTALVLVLGLAVFSRESPRAAENV